MAADAWERLRKPLLYLPELYRGKSMAVGWEPVNQGSQE